MFCVIVPHCLETLHDRTNNMNGVSRHVACLSCRDRKVRCNGEQPACEKCRQAGEKCIYLPASRPSKADLAQKVDTLQQRLGKCSSQ